MSEEMSLSEHAAEILDKLESSFNEMKLELDKFAVVPTIEVMKGPLPLPRIRDIPRRHPFSELETILEDNEPFSRSHPVNLTENASTSLLQICDGYSCKQEPTVAFYNCSPIEDCAGYVPKEDEKMEAREIFSNNRPGEEHHGDEMKGYRERYYYPITEKEMEAREIFSSSRPGEEHHGDEMKGYRERYYYPITEKQVDPGDISYDNRPRRNLDEDGNRGWREKRYYPEAERNRYYYPKAEREMDPGDISYDNRSRRNLDEDGNRGWREKRYYPEAERTRYYYPKAEREMEAGDISNGNNNPIYTGDEDQNRGCRRKTYYPKAERKGKSSKTSSSYKHWDKHEPEGKYSNTKYSKKRDC